MTLPLTGAGPSGAGTLDPSTISGLALWLKADAITSLTDGQAIATWTDSSSNARNATQATAGARPTYKTGILNGLPVARLDGGDYVETATFALNGGSVPTGITMFGVATLTAAGSFPMLAVWDSSTNELRCNDTTGKPEFTANGGGPGFGTAAAITGTGAHVMTGRFTDSSDAIECWVDGAATATGTSAAALTNLTRSAVIGARTGGSLFWTGDIGEVLIYNGALSNTDRAAVEAYLKGKWGTP